MAWISRGVGPAGVGVSASRARSRSTASVPSSTAARSARSAGWSAASVAEEALASRSCARVEALGT